jgi:hypothetical protein
LQYDGDGEVGEKEKGRKGWMEKKERKEKGREEGRMKEG